VAIRAVGVVVDRFLEVDHQLELWDMGVPRTGYRVPGTEYRVPSTEYRVRHSTPDERLGDDSAGVRASRTGSLGSELGTRYSVLGTSHHPHPHDVALQSAVDRIRTRWGVRGVRVGR
jgi:hypothetical protein